MEYRTGDGVRFNVYNIVEKKKKKTQPRLLTKGERKFLEIIETGYLTRNISYSLRLDRYSRNGKHTFDFVPEIFDTFEFITGDIVYSVDNMLTWEVKE